MSADELNINKCTVHQIITQDMNIRKVGAKMVPKHLNDDQKARRNEASAETLERLETEPDFLTRVIAGDESWFLDYDPETKRQSREWHTSQSPRQKKARMSKSRQWSSFSSILAGWFIKNLYTWCHSESKILS
jgi:hypothetical protein